MNIKSLSINGFKSFGKKTVFDFNKSITAIVGPNGSGKSNITEAMRFVLGEQSFKSLRTKEVTDLLFRGANEKVNMLSVAITFDQTDKIKSHTENILVKNALEKGEVDISRIVYADGKSLYKINNQEVRLKDVQEALLMLSIGSKTNWHISQGESDKILLATPDTRREIIEDALGLRSYHAKINESVKKLVKAELNIREAKLKRKELQPEIQILEKQIEKIEKLKVYKVELEEKFTLYKNAKENNLNKKLEESNNLGALKILEDNKNEIVQQIKSIEREYHNSGALDINVIENKKQKEEELRKVIENKLNQKNKEKQDGENLLSYISLELDKNNLEIKNILNDLHSLTIAGNEIMFKESDVERLRIKADSLSSGENMSIADFSDIIKSIKNDIDNLISKGVIVSKDNVKEISYLTNIERRVQEKLLMLSQEKEETKAKLNDINPECEQLNLQMKIVNENIDALVKELFEFKFKGSQYELDTQKLQMQIKQIDEKIEKINRFEYIIKELTQEIDDIKYEMRKIFGVDFAFTVNQNNQNDNVQYTHEEIHNLEKAIERLKVRIEDTQVIDSEDIVSNFENLKDKDIYLLNEIQDLEKSILNLEDLIKDLEQRLKSDFAAGVLVINDYFNLYIQKLFGGGKGELKVVEMANSKNKKENNNQADQAEVDEIELNEDVKIGVEVEVELPKKKVKGLHSLSGGERALVSIALTVAILNNNPSPFMILDEADATLDEANARRYGELLEVIKEKTKLIVVTHNRETMSFADEVYGITLEKSGASKVLSVSFEDALSYAK